MEHFKIKGAYITLGQFVKAASLVSSGGMVKHFLEENVILLNGVEENKRGKKLYPKDVLV
ncbi:MAG: RNA-binding S4 domain-containing protein, partial [Acholeplasmataceae bacterium]